MGVAEPVRQRAAPRASAGVADDESVELDDVVDDAVGPGRTRP